MRSLVLFLALGCSAKTDSDASVEEDGGPAMLEPPAEGEGFQLAMSGVAPPFSEVWLCEVYKIPVDDMAHVKWVKYNQNEGTHHMTLSTLGMGPSGLEYGSHDCNDLYGDTSLMQDQIMFFGAQGEASGEMHLPDGVVASLPATIDVIHEVHYVNPTDEEVEIYSQVNGYTVPADDSNESIWGGQTRDENIFIPAAEGDAPAVHTEWSRCVFNEDVEVHFLAAHQHELGTFFEVSLFDGAEVGEVFYTNDDWHNPNITQFDPPLVIPQGQGFEWACTWTNPEEREVVYGLDSTDEMCNLAMVHTPFSMTAECVVVETSDGVLWESGT